MLKGYIAGSLFNEAEKRQRQYEGNALKELTGDKVEWYNPIDAPINDKVQLPTAQSIFHGDTTQILDCDIIVADLTNNDVGVAMELGIAYGLSYARTMLESIFDGNKDLEIIKDALAQVGITNKLIYGVCSDIRLATANQYEGLHVPYGLNQYVIGGIESMNSVITSNFDSAAELLTKRLNAMPKTEESADE